MLGNGATSYAIKYNFGTMICMASLKVKTSDFILVSHGVITVIRKKRCAYMVHGRVIKFKNAIFAMLSCDEYKLKWRGVVWLRV